MNVDKLDFFSKFSEFSKNIIPSLKDLIDNKEFHNNLDKAGGVVSLIGVGLQIYDTIKKNLETDEDRASNSLIRIVFAQQRMHSKMQAKNTLMGKK